MADYKELLRRAVSALPENNGSARRAVYEKARSALVGQLRAITPPLPAREITQHRLQLEDCIRQVEQEASEAVITLGRDNVLSARPSSPPPPAPRPGPEAVQPAEPPRPVEPPKPVDVPRAVETPKPVEAPKPVETPAAARDAMSIEDIISQAADTVGAPVKLVKDESPKPLDEPEQRSIPSIVARAEAAKTGPTSPLIPPSNVRVMETALKAPNFEPRRDAAPLAANTLVEPVRSTARLEPALGNQAVARQQVIAPIAVLEPQPVEKALSTVREVELEPDPSEAEGAIERAIETLDREARGEKTEPLPERSLDNYAAFNVAKAPDDAGFADTAQPQRGGAGLTIFLVVFAILLAGVGGAGFWAWREGYVDLDQMFGQAQAPVTETAETTPITTPTLDPVQPTEGPGNTSGTASTETVDSELSGLEADERLEPTPQAVQPTGSETVLPDIGTGEIKSEDRLPGTESTTTAANDPAASVDPAVLAGSQSLLLEASQDGTTGAVPFSGTVEWTEGVDELGLPTLKGAASIPARNLGVDITIRKNSDPSLPASHLMEVDFDVSDTFIGGTIANLPGILLKDEELVPGTALVGASARVVGNSFLFALSATPADATANTNLLENRRWMDLAVVYGTGRNAIITLEKDDTAQALFDKVFATWAQ
ncbi:hypothetical protein SAMN05428969_2081 [Devosia sp. YR412]|uniref:hypothetical protein n=1 Tax=Devosia sp. YR412 TaxID=1881030 RepID=UPI0008C35F22|nr:hypothetical protein [Devosia sp. YR412]SEQ12385.1 hypothetical protein SAMN05428969_2081 [Devosia sp. YR412]